MKEVFEPESFVSLEAVPDKYKAEVMARAINLQLEAIRDEIKEKEAELELAVELLAGAESDEDKKAGEAMVKEIQTSIERVLRSAYSYKGNISAKDLRTVLSMSSMYSVLAERQHGITPHRLRGTRDLTKLNHFSPEDQLSSEEQETIEHYDRIAIKLLQRVQQEQQAVLESLVKEGFPLLFPKETAALSDEEEQFKGVCLRSFAMVASEQMKRDFEIMSRKPELQDDEESSFYFPEKLKRFKKNFREQFNDKSTPLEWQERADAYVNSAEFEKTVRIFIAYHVDFGKQVLLRYGGLGGYDYSSFNL